MSDVTITVRGQHEQRVAPEEAVVRLTAAADGAERGTVVEAVAAIAMPVREELSERKAAGALTDWTSQRVSVWAERPWNQDGRRLDPVHHASVEITATFTNFMALSDWLGDLAERDGIHIGGVDWRLSTDTRTRVEREVATVAVAVAVERARAYAAAIGRPHLTPLEIADLGLLSDATAPQPMTMMRGAAMHSAASDSLVDFHPEDIVITAGVEARFTAGIAAG